MKYPIFIKSIYVNFHALYFRSLGSPLFLIFSFHSSFCGVTSCHNEKSELVEWVAFSFHNRLRFPPVLRIYLSSFIYKPNRSKGTTTKDKKKQQWYTIYTFTAVKIEKQLYACVLCEREYCFDRRVKWIHARAT